MRVATTLVAAVAAVSMAMPSPAQAGALCYDKYTEKACQEVQNLICYLFGKCF